VADDAINFFQLSPQKFNMKTLKTNLVEEKEKQNISSPHNNMAMHQGAFIGLMAPIRSLSLGVFYRHSTRTQSYLGLFGMMLISVCSVIFFRGIGR